MMPHSRCPECALSLCPGCAPHSHSVNTEGHMIPVSHLVCGVPCRDLLLNNPYMQTAKEEFSKQCSQRWASTELTEDQQEILLAEAERLNQSVLLPHQGQISFSMHQKAFELRMRNPKYDDSLSGCLRTEFLLSPLPAAVLVQHLMQYSDRPMHERPNYEMFQYLKQEVAYEHAMHCLHTNVGPSAQEFYNDMGLVFALFPIDKSHLKQLSLSKGSIITALVKKSLENPLFLAHPQQRFVDEVRLESRFDTFVEEFEPIFQMYQARLIHIAAARAQRRIKPQLFDHNQLEELMGKFNVSREDVTRAFQFEEWFFTHFVKEDGEEQMPDDKWHSIVMHLLSAHGLTPFERLNPNSILGVLWLCGRISDQTNPNHIPPLKTFIWSDCPVLASVCNNPSAQSKGEAVVAVMNDEANKMGMSPPYLAQKASLVMEIMNWMIVAANPETQTPFGFALQHYTSVLETLDREAMERAEAEQTRQRKERAMQQQAQFRLEQAERNLLAKEERQCPTPGCGVNFTFYYPKGLTAETYQNETKDGQLDLDLYCRNCRNIICTHCKAFFLTEAEEMFLKLCKNCLKIQCLSCKRTIGNYQTIAKQVCTDCYEDRVCKCGEMIPNHNSKIKLCSACNICLGACKGQLGTISEQMMQMCNSCLELMHVTFS